MNAPFIQIPGGLRAVIFLMRADLKHLHDDLDLPSHNSLAPCALCPCNSADMPWWNLTKTARWVTKTWKHAEWRVKFPLHHPIFEVVSIECICMDIMHILHLGITMYLLGSVLWVLTQEVLGGSAKANMETIWQDILSEYDVQGATTRYSSIKLSMFVVKPSVKLKGKAQEIKCLVPILRAVWDKRCDDTVVHHRLISRALMLMHMIDNTLDESRGMFTLPDDLKRRYQSYIWAYLETQNAIAVKYQAHRPKVFNVTYKSHALVHSSQQERASSNHLWNVNAQFNVVLMRREGFVKSVWFRLRFAPRIHFFVVGLAGASRHAVPLLHSI